MQESAKRDVTRRDAANLALPKRTNSSKNLATLYGCRYPLDYFFTPRIASFAALATRNLTTVLAGILIFCCVFGLTAMRAFLFCFTSLPKPGKTNSPFFLVSLYARLQSVSRNTPAVLLVVSVAVASAT